MTPRPPHGGGLRLQAEGAGPAKFRPSAEVRRRARS
jgi:hypothetical protein